MKYICLNQNKVAMVDDDDYEKLSKYSWTYNPHGGHYASRTDRSGDKQKTILMHREIIGAKKGQQVDHVNRDRLDNRKENLRICSPGENARNAGKRKDGVTSNFKGVYFREGKYAASIQMGRKRLHLGYYKYELNAAYYYNLNAKKLHGEFAYLNEIPENYTPTEEYAPNNARGMYSKYRGVTYSKRDGKFYSYIQHKGKRFHIGSFITERIAAEMYNVFAIELHGERAILNSFSEYEGLIAK